MKASVMNKVVMSVFAAAMVSCGSQKGTSAAVKSEGAPSQMLLCGLMYQDLSIQKDPVFTKNFELSWPSTEGKDGHIEMYGVTPNTNDYYAFLTENNGDVNQLVLGIGRSSTHAHSDAIFDLSTIGTAMTIANSINEKQTFGLTCKKK
jgi:hypothetical protein